MEFARPKFVRCEGLAQALFVFNGVVSGVVGNRLSFFSLQVSLRRRLAAVDASIRNREKEERKKKRISVTRKQK